MYKTSLELLAPARNADIGIEAIRHGADAVYIGGPRFGARAAAGNNVDEIKRLVDYAHCFKAKVYVTINTLLHSDELSEVKSLIEQLQEIGVDALIVQDPVVRDLVNSLPAERRIRLHASTQMDNRTADKVRMLLSQGYEQIVLARELSLEEIKDIHNQCPEVSLEAFVHGALCVSLSGLCYVSEVLFDRSANRGECAQVCRMEFDLEDEKGVKIVRNKHLLSLRDLCQIDALEDMAEAGVRSFKIEGRLKDMSYVKNVTAAYSQALNALCEKFPDRYQRASMGSVDYAFRPDVRKSFNRGFTHYFLYGRNDDIFSFDTPKATGEPIGKVTSVNQQRGSAYIDLRLDDGVTLTNGDGLCFFNRNRSLIGLRVNRVEKSRVYPYVMPHDLLPGMTVYRNHDKHFNDVLAGQSAERFIPVDITMDYSEGEFVLTMCDDSHSTELHCPYTAELARTHQSENVRRELSRLGNTFCRANSVDLLYEKNYFIPASKLSEWRRELVRKHSQIIDYQNDSSFERNPSIQNSSFNNSSLLTHHSPLMQCRHCLRYAFGWCARRQQLTSEPPKQLFLRLRNGARLSLDFDCKVCMMNVYKA